MYLLFRFHTVVEVDVEVEAEDGILIHIYLWYIIYREVFPCGVAEGCDEWRLRAHIHSNQGLHLLERSFFQRYLTKATILTKTLTEGN